MELNKRYFDTFDRNRVLIPVAERDKSVVCKVVWMNGGRTVHGGTTTVPVSLFDNPRIGFVQDVLSEDGSVREEAEPRRAPRERRERYSDR